MDKIGERLKEKIKNSKYTQKEIAAILKTTQKTLSSYTQGKVSITVEMLSKICELIDVSMEYIVYGKEKEQLTEHENKLIEKFRLLNEKDKIKTEGYIEGLLKEQEMLYASQNIEKEEKNSDTG